MVDIQTTTVCCMCGDVGFSDRLFRCHKCRNRFQHSIAAGGGCVNCIHVGVITAAGGDWCFIEGKKHQPSRRRLRRHHHHHHRHGIHTRNSIPTSSDVCCCSCDSYCSNYYRESSGLVEVCDWCQTEERSGRLGSSSKKSGGGLEGEVTSRSVYSGDKIKQHDREETGERGKNPSGTPSPRPTTRRYKLLKDVMC